MIGRALSILMVLLGMQVHGETVLVPKGATWKYFPGNVTEDWFQTRFDDSSWQSGRAQLGYGEGDEQTLVYDDPPAFAPNAIYYRCTFLVTNRTQIHALTLRLLADDGAVVYLNGREFLRWNMPGGPIDYTTPALGNVETNENDYRQFGFDAFQLLAGTNYLSAEVHQHNLGKADSSFDLELLANMPLLRPNIAITSPSDGVQWVGGDLLLQTSSSDNAGRVVYVDFMTNGVFLGRATSEPFSFNWVQPPEGGYTLTARAVDDFFFSRESEPVHLYVGELVLPRVTRGPYLQSGSTTGMVIRWRTDWQSEGVVRYRTNGLLENAVTNSAALYEHEAILSGLQADTTYFYSVGTSTQAMTAGGNFSFRTAPTNTRPLRLWVVGDSGTADDYARNVRDSFYAFAGIPTADLFLMLGDNAYGGGSDYEYQKAVFDMYPELLRHTVLWPTIGNHDAEDNIGPDGNQAAPYLNIFHLPRNGECGGVPSGSESYYSFDYGNLHVVCLDSFLSDRSTNGPMLTWLAEDLAATEKDWIIAFWHHPVYSWGSHNSDGDEYFMSEMRERALPILESYGVDLVLSGHSHVYERSFLLNAHYGPSWSLTPEMILDGSAGNPASNHPYRKPSGGMGANRGTVYVVCGCSGEGGAGEGFPLHPAMALNHGGFGSLIVDVDDLKLTCRFLRPSMAIEDAFCIDKSGPATSGPKLKIIRATDGITVSWPTSNPRFNLEKTESVLGSEWRREDQAPKVVGRQNTLTIPLAAENQFFRLRNE